MSNLKTALTFIIGLALGGGGVSLLQSQMTSGGHDMETMSMSKPAVATADAPSTAAYKVGMDKMMAGMMVPYTGNADVDFAKGMIPHHQGAIDMAKVALEFGKDPEIRKLAETIAAAQTGEITFMQNWLKANGG
jgi:uncharacterized protein (DUF305 family)